MAGVLTMQESRQTTNAARIPTARMIDGILRLLFFIPFSSYALI
jgi:hypothetical protein